MTSKERPFAPTAMEDTEVILVLMNLTRKGLRLLLSMAAMKLGKRKRKMPDDNYRN